MGDKGNVSNLIKITRPDKDKDFSYDQSYYFSGTGKPWLVPQLSYPLLSITQAILIIIHLPKRLVIPDSIPQ